MIDAHSHIWTRNVEQFPLANGQTVDDLDPPSFNYDELIALVGDVGAQAIIEKHKDCMVFVPTDDAGVVVDIDRPQDLA